MNHFFSQTHFGIEKAFSSRKRDLLLLCTLAVQGSTHCKPVTITGRDGQSLMAINWNNESTSVLFSNKRLKNQIKLNTNTTPVIQITVYSIFQTLMKARISSTIFLTLTA